MARRKHTDAINHPVDAINRPAAPTKTIEPMEMLPPDSMREFKEAAPGERTTDRATNPELMAETIEVVPALDLHKKDKLAALSFDNEPVTVHIHETSDEQADSNFSISVGGKTEVFFRGQTKTVARKFVEGLCRAKPVGFRWEEYTRDDGSRAVRYPSRTGLRYPFSIVKDPNPRAGQEWANRIIRQS